MCLFVGSFGACCFCWFFAACSCLCSFACVRGLLSQSRCEAAARLRTKRPRPPPLMMCKNGADARQRCPLTGDVSRQRRAKPQRGATLGVSGFFCFFFVLVGAASRPCGEATDGAHARRAVARRDEATRRCDETAPGVLCRKQRGRRARRARGDACDDANFLADASSLTHHVAVVLRSALTRVRALADAAQSQPAQDCEEAHKALHSPPERQGAHCRRKCCSLPHFFLSLARGVSTRCVA